MSDKQQLADLDTRLGKGQGAKRERAKLTARLEADKAEVVRRLSGRRVCAKCGAIYKNSLEAESPKACEICGGELIVRSDDQPEAVQRRLQVYEEQTEPLIAYYSAAGKLRSAAAAGTEDEVFAWIKEALDCCSGMAEATGALRHDNA